MKVLLAASEVAGFAKTGGLADVAGALPRALAERGHQCAVILPLYRSACTSRQPLVRTELTFEVPVGGRQVAGRLWRSHLPGSDVPVYLVEHTDFFERDDPSRGRGFYQFTLPNGHKSDYPDNCERFVFFCRAILEALPLLDFWPDVLHANDWQTGLVPAYLHEHYRQRPGYQRIRTLFTIHNIAYQGNFPAHDMMTAGLDWRLFNYLQLEFYNHLSFLKAGLIFANALNTVSPRYALEIQTSDPGSGGFGMEGVLAERRERLYGIVNGVDYKEWDPARDPHLAVHYDADSVAQGKPICKAVLQRHFGLPELPRAPLFGMISRLVEQKGVDLLGQIAEALLADDAQIVVLGLGHAKYHRLLQHLRARHPRQVGIHLGHDEPLAHQIEAGVDMYLMPSWFEPCGLNQLYSLKYGTVPIVRATGGLADTVIDATPATLAARSATGFAFGPFTAGAFLDAVRRALHVYRDEPETWLQLMQAGMRQDWSWNRSAVEYERLYAKISAG